MSNLDTAKNLANALETRDLEGLQAFLADDFRAKGGTLELNKAQTLGYLQIFFTAFPDHHFDFTEFNENGDLVTCSGQETGTHTGVLNLNPLGMPVSLPATGKAFRLPKSKYTFRVAGAKVVHFSEETVTGGGLAGILDQLGVKLP